MHIGLPKAGSTTLQAFMAAHVDTLAKLGVIWPAFGRYELSHHRYVRGREGDKDLSGFSEVVRIVAQNPDKTVVVSSEAMISTPPPHIARLRMMLGDRPALAIVYLRDFAEWLPSMYSQAVRAGRMEADFDSYFELRLEQLADVVEQIGAWNTALNGAVRVRVLGDQGLAGAGLVDDFLSILGLSREALGAPRPPRDRNVRPDWVSLEVLRLVFSHLSRHGALDPDEKRRTAFIKRRLIRALDRSALTAESAPYMTQEQHQRARARFADLIGRLNAINSTWALRMPPPGDFTPRAFAPRIDAIDPGLLNMIKVTLRDAFVGPPPLPQDRPATVSERMRRTRSLNGIVGLEEAGVDPETRRRVVEALEPAAIEAFKAVAAKESARARSLARRLKARREPLAPRRADRGPASKGGA